MPEKSIYKSKSFWLGITGMAGAIGAWATGAIEPKEAIEAIGAALGLIFLRHGQGVAIK